MIIYFPAVPLLNICELDVFVANLVADSHVGSVHFGTDTPRNTIGAKDGSTQAKFSLATPRPSRNACVSCKRCRRQSTVWTRQS